jgi:hypothetical protein
MINKRLARTIADQIEGDILSMIYGAGTATNAAPPPPLTVDAVMRAMDLLKVPPPPVFASSEEYPRDTFWTFEREGREYVIGHPDLWAKVPPSVRDWDPCNLAAIRIRDVDHPAEGELRGKIRFWMATASHIPGRPVTWPRDVTVAPSAKSRLSQPLPLSSVIG